MNSNNELKSWITLVILSIIWGTSFILIKKALISFSPMQVALLRVTISGLAFMPIFVIRFRKIDWSQWWFYLIIAVTGSGLPAFLYATAQTQISSAMSGILNSLSPIFAVVIGIQFFSKKITRRQTAGIILGFAGASALILLGSKGMALGGQLLYASLIVIGAICYAANINLVKEFFQDTKPLNLNSAAFVLLGLPMFIFLPFSGVADVILYEPGAWKALVAVSLLAIVSTVICLIFFYKLVQETDAVFASSVAYLIPIVALIWGYVDGEYIGVWHLLSMAIIIVGVYLIREKGQKADSLNHFTD